jgi:hypothetical protein
MLQGSSSSLNAAGTNSPADIRAQALVTQGNITTGGEARQRLRELSSPLRFQGEGDDLLEAIESQHEEGTINLQTYRMYADTLASIRSNLPPNANAAAANIGARINGPANLTPRTVRFPQLPQHTALMGGLPPGLSRAQRSTISLFLCHLEQLGSSWLHLVPANSGVRPAALEQAVNAGIRDHGLQPNTRAALNQAFEYSLKP